MINKMKVWANDGISNSGIKALEKGGFEVITTKVAQEQVANYLNTHSIDVLLVRSATKVRQDIIDNCPGLKIIGRGGVGMDNIDVDYARGKGIHVINTPASSSESVAELVFAHLFTGVRFLHDSNRNMPLEGDANFGKLKNGFRAYFGVARGFESEKILGSSSFYKGITEFEKLKKGDLISFKNKGVKYIENTAKPKKEIIDHPLPLNYLFRGNFKPERQSWSIFDTQLNRHIPEFFCRLSFLRPQVWF